MNGSPGEPRVLVYYFSSAPLKERLVARLCADYGRWLGGYRTSETRSGASRTGYELQPLGGERVTLASKDLLSPVSFNKYGVSLEALEAAALPALEAAAAAGRILLMDELGSIALLSDKFTRRAAELLFSPASCLVFCRRGAKTFEEAFAKMGAREITLDEPGWAEAVAAARTWLDSLIPFTPMEKKE